MSEQKIALTNCPDIISNMLYTIRNCYVAGSIKNK